MIFITKKTSNHEEDFTNLRLADKRPGFPNPFPESFQLTIKDANNGFYQLTMVNILGQKVYSAEGSIEEINKGLSSVGKQLSPGNFIVTLQVKDKVVHRQQIVKW